MMNSVTVQFSDATESEVVAVFASPQDGGSYAHMGEVDTSDPRLETFLAQLPPSVAPIFRE